MPMVTSLSMVMIRYTRTTLMPALPRVTLSLPTPVLDTLALYDVQNLHRVMEVSVFKMIFLSLLAED